MELRDSDFFKTFLRDEPCAIAAPRTPSHKESGYAPLMKAAARETGAKEAKIYCEGRFALDEQTVFPAIFPCRERLDRGGCVWKEELNGSHF